MTSGQVPDEAPAEPDPDLCVDEGLVPFVAQVSSGDTCDKGSALMGGTPMAEKMPFPVVHDFRGMDCPGAVPICLDHDLKKLAGVAEKIMVVRNRLLATGWLDGGLEHGASALRDHKAGICWRSSTRAGHLIVATILQEGNTVINNRAFRGPLLVITRWRLREISLTTRPADADVFFILGGPLSLTLR